ncbi:hypothetical protein [Actinoalloteichus sp. GBA129-24]|uniref:hypothetical protein n=1 Tax=Actinoalloteichus sp. GBA129-24 TaxID=1612551 RepID=UPI000950ACF6|nr:hypothetical protein [Actinoalloteichus sp. GBA129-24]APU20418.1 hypothetical protein UA75_12030 [Actinoalloteichus sp. GBA129-24]
MFEEPLPNGSDDGVREWMRVELSCPRDPTPLLAGLPARPVDEDPVAVTGAVEEPAGVRLSAGVREDAGSRLVVVQVAAPSCDVLLLRALHAGCSVRGVHRMPGGRRSTACAAAPGPDRGSDTGVAPAAGAAREAEAKKEPT